MPKVVDSPRRRERSSRLGCTVRTRRSAVRYVWPRPRTLGVSQNSRPSLAAYPTWHRVTRKRRAAARLNCSCAASVLGVWRGMRSLNARITSRPRTSPSMMSALAAMLTDNRTIDLLSARVESSPRASLRVQEENLMTVSERNPTPSNRLGLDGLEFVEFTTTQPLVLGALLEKMGFRAVARHRSREVLLYRQGGMNLVVNAHPGVVRAAAGDEPVTAVGAMAFRVADAGEAHRQTVALGAWDLPSRAAAMELIIPGIRGAGDSHIYFVDRHRDFSIYDVDFTPIVGADPHPPAMAGLHYFGLVQTAFPERTAAWLEFYQ